MIEFDVCKLGLTTSEALDRLSYALKAELQNCECSRHFLKGLNTWVCDAYHHNSAHSSFRWTSAVIVILEIFAFLLYHSYGSDRLKSLEAEIFFLFLFLVVNLYLVGWDSMLRHTEMHTRAETMLQAIQDCKIHQPWKIGQYPHLHTPQSPCISVQWTYRDNQLINLPCHLLVEGDVIVLRPGHISPGKCQSFTEESNQSYELSGGTIFAPANEYSSEGFSSPRLRKPVKPSKFIMLETPYVNSFRLALQYSLHRPVTLFNRERHTVISHYLEHIIIPAVVAVALCVGALHAAYLAPAHSEWTEQMLLRPSLAVLPLLPLALPLCWILLNTYGMARLLTIVHLSKNKEVSCSEAHDLEWKPVDPFEEMEEIAPTICTKSVNWMELKTNFIDLLLAKKGCLWRSANLLQVLGSITALCCVDKKGILSWPNPTAEKVFFLKPPKSKAASEDNTYLFNNSVDAEEKCDVLQLFKEEETLLELKRMIKMNKKKDLRDHMYHPGSQVEVLDLTHNINSPFGIQFDDPNWKSYIGNLKPLGLGILLNTCNPAAQQHYSKFCDHIACESLYNDAAVPVVNKRCLCELAKQIGFTNSVVDFYELQQQLGLFRHVHPEVIQKGRLARTLNYPRLKMPFPNISCAIVKDLHRGSFQLFSQGTADLVLDACNEYWNGEDICILTESDRKRILDFYHRSSLTAHCMGYAYCPLSMVLNNFFSDAYIELPADSSHLFPSLKSINTSLRSWDQQSFDGCNRPFLNRYLSSDSLLLQDQEDINDDPVAETNSCLHQLGNEIFIGMVTMQYQACPDFVQLIEHLDKACIRFVHFSKENELRSRVFSEKMGLESGWNCHISLLSEKNWSESCHSKNFQTSQTPFGKSTLQCKLVSTDAAQNNSQSTKAQSAKSLDLSQSIVLRKILQKKTPLRCVSAPSIVNLDTTVVKFEDEISMHSKSEDSLSTTGLFTSRPDDDNEQVGLCDHISNFQTNADSSVQEILIMDDSNLSHSPSHVTESTDQSAPVTFDMSNRAKLPKGTENIRPHIENVDNVPLLVSLFTDCTPEATREMICIMQEYGEVVCCLGSSANYQNMPILLQADVSIAIEPLHPQLCMQQPVFETPLNEEKTGPTELSCILNSLPCALSFHRDDPVSLYHLIMEARHFMSTMRNSFQFILCCCLSVTLLQMLAAVFFLPLPLPPAHLLWLICLEIPLLSFSLLGNPVDSQVTTLATGKNLKVVNKQTIIFFLACYCAKFCPSVIVALSCFTSIIAKFCHQQSDKAPGPCWIFLNIGHGKHDAAKESWKAGLTISQNTLAFLLVIYFVLISLGFIHRSHLLWKSNLFVNKCWLIIAPIVILLQLIFSLIDVSVHVTEGADPKKFFAEVPYYVWLLGCLWPLLLVPLNELVKQHEIKVNVRQQKKARLEFGTKLGMNSPF